MGSVLETVMLVCFGFSWPINVMKAYKARSAKGTSLAFILLIITGYVAGICAKITNGQFNYVLLVYLLNLAIVFTNLIVYFRNCSLDRRFEKMTRTTKKNDSVILFGGTADKSIPVAEIAQDYEFNFKMLNRSCYALSLKDAKKVYAEQIEKLNPESVILHIGEEDLSMFEKNTADFDVQYMDLISYIKRTNSKVRIALVSNMAKDNSAIYNEMNRHIKAISDSEKCVFLNIDNAKLWEPENTKELMAFMYSTGFDRPLNVKKPLGDICEVIYSYAYQNGILHYVESKAM